jgi:hypothetical protein
VGKQGAARIAADSGCARHPQLSMPPTDSAAVGFFLEQILVAPPVKPVRRASRWPGMSHLAEQFVPAASELLS